MTTQPSKLISDKKCAEIEVSSIKLLWHDNA